MFLRTCHWYRKDVQLYIFSLLKLADLLERSWGQQVAIVKNATRVKSVQ